MKIQIMSDCHLEHRYSQRPTYGLQFDATADILVIAGDLHFLMEGCRFLKDCGFKKDIIYVPGNHEYYGQVKDEVEAEAIDFCKNTRVRLLLNDTFVKQGVKFIGSTFWTDFNIFNDVTLGMRSCLTGLNDFRVIKLNQKQTWTPTDHLNAHLVAREFVLNELKKTDHSGSIVIVTHHGPSIKSVEDRYRFDSITSGFVSNMEKLIRHFKPALWIHGHTHHRKMYQIDKTEIICYPYGYPNELNYYHPLTVEV